MAEENGNVTSLGNFRKEKEEAPQEELIFMCTLCNCSTWRMMRKSCGHGVIECSTCGQTRIENDDDTKAAWFRMLDTAPTDPAEIDKLGDDSNRINNHGAGSEELAIRRTLKKMNDMAAEGQLAFVGGYSRNGAGFWWIGANDADERDWIVDKIEQIVQHTKHAKYDDA